MNPTTTKVLTSLVPAAAFGLNLLVPEVPAIVWSALINALINGDVTLEHIQQFLKDHNVKTYEEFPEQKDKFSAVNQP